MARSIEDVGEVDQVVGQWWLTCVTAHLKQSVDYDYEIDGQAVTISEVRPAWRGAPGEVTHMPVARFRFIKVTGFWRIFCICTSGKFQTYVPIFEVNDLVDALDVIESDQYGCFFG